MIDDVQVGHRLLIDDGALRFVVESKTADHLVCLCEVGGTLRSNKGVNLPDSDLRVDALTPKDIEDAAWAVASGLDYLALSFVRSADDVVALRKILSELGSDIHIVSKIETPQAIRDIDAIIDASDAILVARGDLGVEMDAAAVPRLQKDMTDRCRRAGKPVIIATQMLQSMVESPVPTRAEVSDVAHAIMDCADAVMLSAETAVGKYPAEAVRMMNRIAAETESFDRPQWDDFPINADVRTVTSTVAGSLAGIAQQVSARAVAVWTERGALARLLSKHRPSKPVIAFVPGEAVARRTALYYGVSAVYASKPADPAARITSVDEVLLGGGWAKPGDLVLIGIGARSLDCGSTGTISIHVVDR